VKQKDIVRGERYRLGRMQYLGRSDLNGAIVTVCGVKKGSVTTQVCNYVTELRRRPAHYTTDIGVRVMACHLFPIADADECMKEIKDERQ
jgi:hypothetical protein